MAPPEVSLLEGARALLLNNRKQGYDPVLKRHFSYTCPSRGEYPWQWFWDSCFHAIALCHIDLNQAKAELRTLLSVQRKDGFIPHVIHWGTGRWSRFHWDLPAYGQSKFGFGAKASALIQPPVLAQAVLRVVEASQDKDFLRETLDAVRRYYLWLHDQRDPDGDGLISVISPYETGMDQLPAYDRVLGAKNPSSLEMHFRDRLLDLNNLVLGRNYNLDAIFRRDAFNVEDVMMNCIYAQGLRDVSELCALAGDETAAGGFRNMAGRVEQAVLSKCYDPKDGAFWSLGTRHEQALKVLTVSSLFPVLLSSIDRKRLGELASVIANPSTFGLPYPLPSVAKNEPAFRPNRSFVIWRGATWVNINWFIAKGLRSRGLLELSNSLSKRTVEMVAAGGFREFYNPITGQGLGARNFGWSTLVVDMP